MAIDKLPKNAKEIPDFPGYYATIEGDIWSGPKKTRRHFCKLKPDTNSTGHLRVSPVKNSVVCRRLVHHLILETFVGPRPKNMECCHYNDVPADNRLKNLRWDTKSNNHKDSFRNGNQTHRGENNPPAKLNSPQVRIIRCLLEFNILTQKEIGTIFGVVHQTISSIKRGVSWK